MACNDYKLDILVDGAPLSRPRKDFGCKGETHIYSAVTDLEEPVTYRWSLDGISPPKPLLSNKPNVSYTFDNKKHVLYCVASNSHCGVQVTVDLNGQDCVVCETKCGTSTVMIPAGELVSLIDFGGKVYPIDGKVTTECKSPSKTNAIAAKEIMRAVKSGVKCKAELLNVGLYPSGNNVNCLTLTITNSPVKFKQVQVGQVKYNFNIDRC